MEDIIGKTFGRWTVIGFAYKNDKNILYYHCKCECGTERDVKKYNLVHGYTKSCGCYSKDVAHSLRFTSLIGKRFGKLFVESIDHKEGSSYFYRCRCDCGNTTIVSRALLTHKQHPTRSCGCLRKCGFRQDITGYVFGNLTVIGFSKRELDHTYWKCRCRCGNELEVEGSHLKSGHTMSCGCLDVSHGGSKVENEIRKWVDSLVESNSVKDRQILDGKEIDMYYPEFNIGIEYNGSAYHASLNGIYGDKPKLYHRDKFLQAKEQGIHLISIFDVDWENNQEKIKMYLRSLFTKQKRFFARKCEIKPISKELADTFTDMYHIQGRTRQNSINYGLYYNDELYAVMSFGTLRLKKTQDGEYELHRYCVKDGYTILGGAEKLLKHFERDYSPKYIRSYSDNDYFLGGIYERLGFENSGQCTPRYYWFLNNQEIKRERCMLKHLKIQYPELLAKAYETNAPNKENFVMVQLGARKVYRSGNTKWEKTYGR